MTHEIYLTTHIGLAIASLSFASIAGYHSIRHQVEKADSLLRTAWATTFITTLSGIILSTITGTSFLATCVSLATFIAAIGAVHSYHAIRHKVSA